MLINVYFLHMYTVPLLEQACLMKHLRNIKWHNYSIVIIVWSSQLYIAWLIWLKVINQFLYCFIPLQNFMFLFRVCIPGLSLRGGGRGFPPVTKNVAPSYFHRKIEPKEIPSCLIPRLLVVFTRQLEILVTTLASPKHSFPCHVTDKLCRTSQALASSCKASLCRGISASLISSRKLEDDLTQALKRYM